MQLMAPLLALASMIPLTAAELKVDHVTVAGRSVAEMQKAFDRVGIVTEFGGPHSNGLTEMAIASFPDGSYLELIGPQPGANVKTHYWGRFMENNGGACAWAVSVEAIEPEAERLKRAGVTTNPSRSGRRRPDGFELKWITAAVGPGPQGSFFPFLIQDETPRERRAWPKGKPSAPQFDGVALVVIAVRDLDSAVSKWRAGFGLAEPQRQGDPAFGASLAWFAGTPVVLAAPQGRESWLADRLNEFGEAPCAFVLKSKLSLSAGKLAPASWFDHRVAWFEDASLQGARIGVEN